MATLIETLIMNIPAMVPQEDSELLLGTAIGLYEKLYLPIEIAENGSVTEYGIDSASYAIKNIVNCFEWGDYGMMRCKIIDLMMFKMLLKIGYIKDANNKYKSILDNIEARWQYVSFTKINDIVTFASLKLE
jgi:hypothetical protein